VDGLRVWKGLNRRVLWMPLFLGIGDDGLSHRRAVWAQAEQ